MSSSRRVSCCLASALLLLTACGRRAPALQVLGDSTRLPAESSSPVESATFDGKTLRLRAARGETLGVEVRWNGALELGVSLELRGVAATVEPFEVRSLEVKEPSTDMYGPSAGPGRYPDVLVPVVGAV